MLYLAVKCCRILAAVRGGSRGGGGGPGGQERPPPPLGDPQTSYRGKKRVHAKMILILNC